MKAAANLDVCRWKIDCRLIPILGLMYSINGIDRTNLAVARITGMEEDLGIETGNRYSIALLIFFVPYVVSRPKASQGQIDRS